MRKSTDVLVKHLGVQHPWSTVPRGCVECSPKVEKEHRCDTARSERCTLVLLWFGNRNVSSDKPQTKGATQSTDHEQVASAQIVNEIQKPDECEDSLDNTEDTSCQERGVGSLDTDALEDRGRVVVDGVDTRGILPEKESTTQEKSVHDLLVLGKCSEWLPESEADGSFLVLDTHVNSADFLEHVDVVSWQLSDP